MTKTVYSIIVRNQSQPWNKLYESRPIETKRSLGKTWEGDMLGTKDLKLKYNIWRRRLTYKETLEIENFDQYYNLHLSYLK